MRSVGLWVSAAAVIVAVISTLAVGCVGAAEASDVDVLPKQYIGRVFAGSKRSFATLSGSLPTDSAVTWLAQSMQFSRISLPFTFEFFAKYRSVGIGRDGALFFNRGLGSCCAAPVAPSLNPVCTFMNFGSPDFCNFNTDYPNLIATSTTYYDPKRSVSSPIGWFADPGMTQRLRPLCGISWIWAGPERMCACLCVFRVCLL